MFRGKELVIAIGQVRDTSSETFLCDTYFLCKFAIRVCFGTQGHCFWVPTKQYNAIISEPMASRGKLSKAFVASSEVIVAPPEVSSISVSIQAAFIQPDWTLLFVDHQVFITFHISKFRHVITEEDLRPSSAVSAALASRSMHLLSPDFLALAWLLVEEPWSCPFTRA